ncbi:MAG: alanine--tRNA ligase [Pseudomonadota bacterium]
MLTTSDIRERYLRFFETQGHTIVSSSPLVPGNDPTLLFTNAGMVQFKDLFLGTETRDYLRATTSQRCVRAGGKHNDLENVGYTARHHTFFEMLGNFSFGDYFKTEAIRFAWQFLTGDQADGCLGLPEDKLWITVFEEDDEAFDIWENRIGVPRERIARIGAKDNFWQMGDTGPCGPCSEIFFDHGPDVWGGPPGTPEEDGDRYIEIWNLVFMQFDRSADGTLTPLPKPSVDTGMGLERIAAVLQHVHSNYEIDLFERLLAASAKAVGTTAHGDASLKVVADHIRSCAFLIVDGVVPGNEGRGYVLRRIIRRAVRHGYKLGCTTPFFHTLVSALVDEMGAAYPELVAQQERVERLLLQEEKRFAETLDNGMKLLDSALETLDGCEIPGELAFRLYDTYGFPLDLTADIARERELSVDEAGFDAAMENQRARARAASQFSVEQSEGVLSSASTAFDGYTTLSVDATVLELYCDGEAVDSLNDGATGVAVLDRTAFYAESGGQVGDQGRLDADGVSVTVHDTRKSGSAFLHAIEVVEGSLRVGQSVLAAVDTARREATQANHSATHLLHEALRQAVGDHVQQRGSLVSPEHLRFDFSNDQPVDADTLATIERHVNAEVRANHVTDIREMPIDAAKALGATMLFGEKYGEVVRVVTLGPDSTELCGGTHVARSGEIGAFRIVSEGAVASGIRRIEALTGAAAIEHVLEGESTLAGLAQDFNVPRAAVAERVRAMQSRIRSLEKDLDQTRSKLALLSGQGLVDDAVEVAGVKVLATVVDGVDPKALRDNVDDLKNRLGEAVVVLAVVDGSAVRVAAGVSKSLSKRLSAGDIVKRVAADVGGKGGGRPDFAQGGGDNPAALPAALAAVAASVEQTLASS